MDEQSRPPLTEQINPSTAELDLLDTHELLHRINDEDRRAAWAVERELDAIGTAVDAITQRLRAGGHLHYFGAGSSGRVAVADAAELPPTFSAPPDLVVAHIAGGPPALLHAVEGAEDDASAAEAEVSDAHVGAGDAVVGISASGRTPYVLAAVDAARHAGALTIGITNDVRSPLAQRSDIPIALLTGAEAVAGSTRMKAASAQKMALTTLSTAVMVKLGRVHGNLMVDVAPTSAKLRARALRVTMLVAGSGEAEASAALTSSGYEVKTAVVMLRRGCSPEEARALLERCNGNLRQALA
ncbi:MAG TPA: N-acetylmuramic acid 6-phosphate etherase [Candidatus Binatus sp.]|nr:N-acetylmuramic acid 6-phosphate etherase [Candidatus Binatus sp.]